MKFLFALLLNLVFTTTFCQNKSFILNGHISGKNDGKIYLVTWNDDWYRIRDSSLIINGDFHFFGQLSGYTNYCYLKMNPSVGQNSDDVNSVQISLENSEMNILLELGHFSKYKMTGCKACEEYKRYESQSGLPDYEKYCKLNPDSPISPRLIYDNLRNDNDIKKAKFLFYELSIVQRNSYYGKQIELKIRSKDLIGSMAPGFSRIDINGNLVELTDVLKNNYVLLEFWGSWCNPCRAEHPDLLRMYEKYHSQGLEIISIADDDSSIAKWKNAVLVDKVGVWKQILRGKKYDENKNTENDQLDIGNLYFVRSFPTLYLIDRSGIVIGSYSTFAPVENKLKSIFNK